MSDLDEIREELGNIRERVCVVNIRMNHARSAATSATVAARAADRNVSRSRAEMRDLLAQFNAGIAKLTELLATRLGPTGKDQPA
jgi:hypothetical protein